MRNFLCHGPLLAQLTVVLSAGALLSACSGDVPSGPSRDAGPTTWDAAFDAHAWDAAQGDAAIDAAHAVELEPGRALFTGFYTEGAAFGDFDGDGAIDAVAGPWWFRGPDFVARHELYTPVLQDVLGYSDDFFSFPYDFDGDGALDVLKVGFPGRAAEWLQNPGNGVGTWQRHALFDGVDDESPAFVDLTGDGRPELVCAHAGAPGYVTWDPANPSARGTFHAIAPGAGFVPFTHGLGVGDLDGDSRSDVIVANGWWQQPPASSALWSFHPAAFGSGGAQMFASDVDGDGDADVITSLAAHGSGLAWYEQKSGAFIEHVLIPEAGDPTIPLHEPHALALADMNGDGVLDVITGERFWGHVPPGPPPFEGPARLYWLELARGATVTLVPHLIDDASGVGTQVWVSDATGDGRPDVVVANKRGSWVFVQR